MERLLFDEASGTLRADDNAIILGKFSARCLTLLIKHENSIVAKEMLLHEGWIKHGLMVSDTSVRQALVNIRKALSTLNISENILRTVPKKGYCLEGGIIRLENSQSITGQPLIPGQQQHQQRRTRWRPTSGSVRVSLGALLLIAITAFWRMHTLMPEIHYEAADQQGNIHYFRQAGISNERYQTLQTLFNEYVSTGDIHLRAPAWVYINNTQFRGRASFFLCYKPLGNHDRCHSVIIIKDVA